MKLNVLLTISLFFILSIILAGCSGGKKDTPDPVIPATAILVYKDGSRITNNQTIDNVPAGTDLNFTCTFTPADASPSTITWASLTAGIVDIYNFGATVKITPRLKGTTTITATAAAGELIRFKVTVKDYVTNVTINPSLITLRKGKTFDLTALVTPSNATNKAVTWSLENPLTSTIASVDANGKVTANGIGQSTVKITSSENSGATATCIVTVPDIYLTVSTDPLPTGVTVSYNTDGTISNIYIKKNISLTIQANTENGGETVVWSTQLNDTDPQKATISTSGSNMTITGKEEGLIFIKAKVSGKTGAWFETNSIPVNIIK